MDTKNAIQKVDESSLAQLGWGDSAMLNAVVARLRALIPNSAKLTDQQLLAGAQRAIMEGKNPFNGEMYITEQMGVVEGYRGLQKDAKRLERMHFHYRAMTNDERTEHGLDGADIGMVCEAWDIDQKREAATVGIPYEPLLGIGIVRKDERNRQPPKGRSWRWVAEMRAYKDALRRSGLSYMAGDSFGYEEEDGEESSLRPGRLALAREKAAEASFIVADAERQQRLAEESEALREAFGEEIGHDVSRQAADDLFGPEPSPEPQKLPYWRISHASIERMQRRLAEETGGYYKHLMHIENTLKQEGFAFVDGSNALEAFQALIRHAQEKQAKEAEAQMQEELPIAVEEEADGE